MTFAVEAILLLSLLKSFKFIFHHFASLIVIELYNGFIPFSHKNSLTYAALRYYLFAFSVLIVPVPFGAAVSF